MITTTCGIVMITPDKKILAAHPTRHYFNQWDLIKGKIDEGETYFQTIHREFYEETGFYLYDLCDSIKDYSAEKNKEYIYKHKQKKLHGFVGIMKKHIDISLFKCSSMVTNFKNLPPFPEIDSFIYINPSDIEVFHSTQQEFICDLNKDGYFEGIDFFKKEPKSDIYG